MINNADIQKDKELLSRKELRKIYEGRVIQVCQETFFFEGESPFKADIVLHPGAAVILPILDDGSLLLIKQWRRAVSEILIEAPAGVLEAGEPKIACAMRELQEETGYSAQKMIPLGRVLSAPGFCNEVLYLFLAEGLVENPLPKDEHEAIDLMAISLQDALAMIDSGEICDAKTIVLIFRYARAKYLI
jgi:ADP-ribose pyrophosphatase